MGRALLGRAAGRADVRLEDPQVLAEIELYGELVIAASGSEGMLSREEIDRALGLVPRSGGQEPGPSASSRP